MLFMYLNVHELYCKKVNYKKLKDKCLLGFFREIYFLGKFFREMSHSLGKFVSFQERNSRNFPGSPVVKTSLPVQGLWV